MKTIYKEDVVLIAGVIALLIIGFAAGFVFGMLSEQEKSNYCENCDEYFNKRISYCQDCGKELQRTRQ